MGGSSAARPHGVGGTVRYLGFEVNDALEMADQAEV